MKKRLNKLGCLIAFRFKKRLKANARVRFCQKLYGYLDHSQYGRYRYQRAGFLKGVPYISPIRGLLIIKREHQKRVLSFLKDKVELYVREIILKPEDFKILTKSLVLGRKSLAKLNKELLK